MATKEEETCRLEPGLFRKWPVYVSGFYETEHPFYRPYKGLLFLFYGAMYASAAYTVPRVTHEAIYAVACIHFTVSIHWVFSTLGLRVATRASLKKMTDRIDEGIFHYQHESFHAEHRKMRDEFGNILKRRIKIYFVIYSISFILVMFISPILGYFLIPEDSKFFTDKMVNPYLPHIFSVPFETKTLRGFFAAYAIDLVIWTCACTTSYSTMSLFMLGMAHLTLHLKILNHSLRNIQRRAVSLYGARYSPGLQLPPLETLFKTRDFHGCLHSCLKENIRHHQTLLTYKMLIQPFTAPTLLSIHSAVVVVVYATLLYLVLQPLPVSMKLKYISMLISEETATFYTCIFGEDVIKESNDLFQSLYDTPWWKYDKDFRQTLHIMMTYTREPLRYKALFLNAYASRESFGHLAKATYSMMNLMSPAKKI